MFFYCFYKLSARGVYFGKYGIDFFRGSSVCVCGNSNPGERIGFFCFQDIHTIDLSAFILDHTNITAFRLIDPKATKRQKRRPWLDVRENHARLRGHRPGHIDHHSKLIVPFRFDDDSVVPIHAKISFHQFRRNIFTTLFQLDSFERNRVKNGNFQQKT